MSDLADLARQRRDSDQALLDAITAARAAGMTWRKIAVQLGYASPQAAFQKYKSLERKLARPQPPRCSACGQILP